MDSILKYVPFAILAFTILSHGLSFVAQVLKDLSKDQPGWLDSVSSAIGKVIDFLNGVKPKAI